MSHERQFFAEMVVDAVAHLDERLPVDMVGIKKVSGGSLLVSFNVIFIATFNCYKREHFTIDEMDLDGTRERKSFFEAFETALVAIFLPTRAFMS